MKFYNVKFQEALENLETDEKIGLNNEQVKERAEKYGSNEFTKKKERSIWSEIFASLTDKMMIILLIAALISALVGELYDAIGIVCAIALGIGIKIVTEGQSKKAADALSKMTGNIFVKVLRNSEITQISKNELVPGDIVFVETGDMVPADGRLLSSIDLKIREDMLTGESDDVEKNADSIIEMEEIPHDGKIIIQEPVPAKQINMLFGGSLVAYGRGTYVVTSIGDSSEMGKIAMNLVENTDETPLQLKLGRLGEMISRFAGIIAIILFIIMLTRIIMSGTMQVDNSGFIAFLNSIGPVKSAFVICIALIVAAVPEGLPTMISMTLAVTKKKMAKINALVTKNEACETVGSVSVICSDKTGTLTQNRMTVEKVYIDGKYTENLSEENSSYFLENCLLNSTADVEINGADVNYLGSATECALLLHHKDKNYIQYRKDADILTQIPFSSKEKKMVTIINSNNSIISLSKGAPEIILSLCTFENLNGKTVKITEERRNSIINEIESLQKKSMRLLGFAYNEFNSAEEVAVDSIASSEELVFTGFVAIKDPLRPDVKDSILTAKNAGVETKMLTGDNIVTAMAIGEELGLLANEMKAVEASYIDVLTDDELKEEIKNIAIVARSKPDTKMRIVQALQSNGEVVAVTGDGINDAPALTRADVGIAMGIAGTEVSKKAADIILTDDSFSTIVQGIKWGRGIYENFQRFIQFQITVNLVAFFIAILSVVFDFQMPFTTIQLLWVNIIMDGPPALSLGLEAIRENVLDRMPTNRKANIITKSMFINMMLNASYLCFILILQIYFNILGASSEIANPLTGASEMETVLFGLFAFGALFNAFNCREFGADSIIPRFLDNKYALSIISFTAIVQIIVTTVFADFFNAVPLSAMMWLKIIGLSSLILVVNEIVKLFIRLFSGNKTKTA